MSRSLVILRLHWEEQNNWKFSRVFEFQSKSQSQQKESSGEKMLIRRKYVSCWLIASYVILLFLNKFERKREEKGQDWFLKEIFSSASE